MKWFRNARAASRQVLCASRTDFVLAGSISQPDEVLRHPVPADTAIEAADVIIEGGDQLIEAKEQLGGVTYRQLGQIMGRDHAYLVHLFHGERAPSRITAQWLVQLLPLSDDAATELLRLAVQKRDYRNYGS